MGVVLQVEPAAWANRKSKLPFLLLTWEKRMERTRARGGREGFTTNMGADIHIGRLLRPRVGTNGARLETEGATIRSEREQLETKA